MNVRRCAPLLVALSSLWWSGCAGCEPPADVRCDGCTVFQGGLVFDGHQRVEGLAVVVDGGGISAVREAPVTVEGGRIVDTDGLTLLPGLIDAHVQLERSGGPPDDLSDQRAEALAACLRLGVTSVVDLGSRAHSIFDLRQRLSDGQLRGPRVFAAGPAHTPTGGLPCVRGTPPGDRCVFIDELDGVVAMDTTLALQPDIASIVQDDGSGFVNVTRFAPETLRAMVARAGAVPVLVHVGKNDDVRDALTAGAHAFANLPGDDDLNGDITAQLVDADAIVIGTRSAFAAQSALAQGSWAPSALALEDNAPSEVLDALADADRTASMREPAFAANAARLEENAEENLRRLIGAHVRLAAGTDAGAPGVLFGVALHDELAAYVAAGMTPVQALQSATRTPAALLGQGRTLGTIRAGAAADLLLVRGDPTVDLAALQDIDAVWLRGKKLDRGALALSGAPDPTLTPLRLRATDDTCLLDADCDGDSACVPEVGRCAPRCDDGACATGRACVDGLCVTGDGCDVLAAARGDHACDNQAACVWLGADQSRCQQAVLNGEPGEGCDRNGRCAEGAQCFDGVCVLLCDPGATPDACAPAACEAQSDTGALVVGRCGDP